MTENAAPRGHWGFDLYHTLHRGRVVEVGGVVMSPRLLRKRGLRAGVATRRASASDAGQRTTQSTDAPPRRVPGAGASTEDQLARRLAEVVCSRARSFHMRTYRDCFVGHDAVDWMLALGLATTRAEAVGIGRSLVEAGLLYHVCHDHDFRDLFLFYQFAPAVRPAAVERPEADKSLAQAELEEIAARLAGSIAQPAERVSVRRGAEGSFAGETVVDWLIKTGAAGTRAQAVAVGLALQHADMLRGDADFRDTPDTSFRVPKPAPGPTTGAMLEHPALGRVRRRSLSGAQGASASPATQDARSLAVVMKQKLRTANNSYRLRTYRNSFKGAEAVDWLVTAGVAESRRHAVTVGRRMMHAGVVRHVADEHTFHDSGHLYRFAEEEDEPPPLVPVHDSLPLAPQLLVTVRGVDAEEPWGPEAEPTVSPAAAGSPAAGPAGPGPAGPASVPEEKKSELSLTVERGEHPAQPQSLTSALSSMTPRGNARTLRTSNKEAAMTIAHLHRRYDTGPMLHDDRLFKLAALVPRRVLHHYARQLHAPPPVGSDWWTIPPMDSHLARRFGPRHNVGFDEEYEAAVLFADISGFSKLAERLLAEREGNTAGAAEALSDYIGKSVHKMVSMICDNGGDVIKFAGDAVFAVFAVPLFDTMEEAAQAAAATSLDVINLDLRAGEVRLQVHCGIGAGRVTGLHVGGMYDRWEYVICGDPIRQVASAEGDAEAGHVVVSPPVRYLLEGSGAELVAVPTGNFELLRCAYPAGLSAPLPSVSELVGAIPADTGDLLRQNLSTYIPRPVVLSVESGGALNMQALRVCSVLFIRLNGLALERGGVDVQRVQAAVLLVQQCIYAFEGTLCRFIVDDKGAGLLAAFGLPPHTHDQDALLAVRAALWITARLRDRSTGLTASIGVATGRLFSGTVGGDVRCEYTVHGTMVNLSARLMAAANEGALVDEDVYRATADQIEYEPAQRLQVKGKSEKVAAYRPIKTRRGRAIDQLQPTVRLIGRRREVVQFERVLRSYDVAEAPKGGVVLVSAEGGMGKSVLLRYCVEMCKPRFLHVLAASGTDIHRRRDYYVWLEIMESLLAISDGMLRDGPSCALYNLLPPDVDPDDALITLQRVFPELISEAGAGTGAGAVTNPWTTATNADRRRANVQELLLRIMCHRAATSMGEEGAAAYGAYADAPEAVRARMLLQRQVFGKIVVVLRAVHWVDMASWELLVRVLREATPLLVVLSARPGLETSQRLRTLVKCQPDLLEMSLPPFTREQTVDIVRDRMGVTNGPLPSALADAICTKSHGHPLFAEELATMIMEPKKQIVRLHEGRCELVNPNDRRWMDALKLPPTVSVLMSTRIDELPPSAEMTLKVASVIGWQFGRTMLQRVHPVTDMDEATLESDLQLLLEHGFIQRMPLSRTLFRFKHALIRETAYESMLYAQRSKVHVAVADFLEPGDEVAGTMGLHLAAASEFERALPLLARAVRHSIATSAWTDGLKQLNALLYQDPKMTNMVEPLLQLQWLRERAVCLLAQGGADGEAAVHLLEALARFGVEPPSRLRGWRRRQAASRSATVTGEVGKLCELLAEVRQRQGDVGAAQRVARFGLRIAGELKPALRKRLEQRLAGLRALQRRSGSHGGAAGVSLEAVDVLGDLRKALAGEADFADASAYAAAPQQQSVAVAPTADRRTTLYCVQSRGLAAARAGHWQDAFRFLTLALWHHRHTSHWAARPRACGKALVAMGLLLDRLDEAKLVAPATINRANVTGLLHVAEGHIDAALGALGATGEALQNAAVHERRAELRTLLVDLATSRRQMADVYLAVRVGVHAETDLEVLAALADVAASTLAPWPDLDLLDFVCGAKVVFAIARDVASSYGYRGPAVLAAVRTVTDALERLRAAMHAAAHKHAIGKPVLRVVDAAVRVAKQQRNVQLAAVLAEAGRWNMPGLRNHALLLAKKVERSARRPAEARAGHVDAAALEVSPGAVARRAGWKELLAGVGGGGSSKSVGGLMSRASLGRRSRGLAVADQAAAEAIAKREDDQRRASKAKTVEVRPSAAVSSSTLEAVPGSPSNPGR